MGWMSRLFFWWRYARGNAGWDTGIIPPELVSLIESRQITPGRAVDLGCGTGTNAVYLAQQGWSVVGIDFLASPIRAAQRKARRAGVADRTRFLVGDVMRLAQLKLDRSFNLALDIGCLHSLTPPQRADYVSGLATITLQGATFMLYMFRPTPQRSLGLEPAQVEELFTPHFRLAWSSLGADVAAGTESAWYRFVRS